MIIEISSNPKYINKICSSSKKIYLKKIVQPFKPSRCIKASFSIIENILDFLTTKGFKRQISMKLFYEYIAIFFNLSPTSSHLYPLQVENCDSNSRLVVGEDDNGKFRLERDKRFFKNRSIIAHIIIHIAISVLSGTHFHLSQVKHLRVKCLAQGHNIKTMSQY